MERDDLTNQIQGLNTSLTSMRIQHNEEMDDMISKYNKSVDMIHAIISTTSLLKEDIENMSFSKRTFSFKNNLNSLFEEREHEQSHWTTLNQWGFSYSRKNKKKTIAI